MPRPISEKIRDWRWWGEQVAHFAIGGAASGLFGLLTLVEPESESIIVLCGLFLATSMGTSREILQNIGDDPAENDSVDSNIDAYAFSLGGFVASLSWLLG